MARLPMQIREVADTPYTGRRPAIPKGLPAETKAWWEQVTRMPHCILWTPVDWQTVLTAVRIHAQFIRNGTGTGAEELRIVSAQLGTTPDTRARLRIVYVDPATAKPKVPPVYFKSPSLRDTPHLLPDGSPWTPENAMRWHKERKERLINADLGPYPKLERSD